MRWAVFSQTHLVTLETKEEQILSPGKLIQFLWIAAQLT
jgi:hypothetical protein